MAKSFEAYFDSVGLSASVRERVDDSMAVFERLLPSGQTIERVFLCDVLIDGELRQWTDLWAFTARYWLCSADFMSQFDVDVSGYEKSIKYLSVQFDDMDLSVASPYAATEGSTFGVEVRTADDLDSYLCATGRNCPFLADIVFDILRKNLRSEVA